MTDRQAELHQQAHEILDILEEQLGGDLQSPGQIDQAFRAAGVDPDLVVTLALLLSESGARHEAEKLAASVEGGKTHDELVKLGRAATISMAIMIGVELGREAASRG